MACTTVGLDVQPYLLLERGRGLLRSSGMRSTLIVVAVGVAGGICLILADRALLWVERRGWIYYRKTKGHTAALAEEFSPAAQAVKRAMEQERIRKNVRPAEGPPLGVDLDKGVARNRHSQPGRQESADPNEIE